MKARSLSPLPLDGCGVAVTRAEEPGGPLSRRFSRRGARVHSWQAIEIVPPEDAEPLARAVASLETYDWIVFASAHAVDAVVAARGPLPAATPRVAAVGRATAAAAERAGFDVRRVPGRFGAVELVARLRATGEMLGARVLLPSSSIARPELAAGLAALGAAVDRVTAYVTRATALDVARCRRELAAGEIDVITFTSPSSVDSVARAFGPTEVARSFEGRLVISIGPATTRALRDSGLEPSGEARPSTLDGVVAATLAAFSGRATGDAPPGARPRRKSE